MNNLILIQQPDQAAVFARVLLETPEGYIAEIEAGPRKGQIVMGLRDHTTPMEPV